MMIKMILLSGDRDGDKDGDESLEMLKRLEGMEMRVEMEVVVVGYLNEEEVN